MGDWQEVVQMRDRWTCKSSAVLDWPQAITQLTAIYFHRSTDSTPLGNSRSGRGEGFSWSQYGLLKNPWQATACQEATSVALIGATWHLP
jgi:hypothetical protein